MDKILSLTLLTISKYSNVLILEMYARFGDILKLICTVAPYLSFNMSNKISQGGLFIYIFISEMETNLCLSDFA